MTLNKRYMFIDMDAANKVCEEIGDFPLWYGFWSKASIIALHYSDKFLQKMNQRLATKEDDPQ